MHDGEGLCETAARLVEEWDSPSPIPPNWTARVLDVLRQVAESNIVSVESGRVFRRVEGGNE